MLPLRTAVVDSPSFVVRGGEPTTFVQGFGSSREGARDIGGLVAKGVTDLGNRLRVNGVNYRLHLPSRVTAMS